VGQAFAHRTVCVIGAGSSGLAALRALSARGFAVDGFERGSRVGGNWLYDNDSGASAAYASLRTNVSRERMQYPSFPMPATFGDYVHHRDMATYLEAYARNFGLFEHIRFRTSVELLSPLADHRWHVRLSGGEHRAYDAVVVANGHDWSPILPDLPGAFAGETLHAHEYRTPDRFADKRVLVVGAGQSAVEIATELSGKARRTLMAVREGRHIVPRYFLGRPSDAFDQALPNRLPWPVVRSVFGLLARVATGRSTTAPLRPTHRLLEERPPVLTDVLLSAVQSGMISLKPAVERLAGDHIDFADATREIVDAIIYATGYRVVFPFLPPDLMPVHGKRLPLYRHMVAPDLYGLYFIGLVDPFGGLLPIVEAQSAWLADVLDGHLALPARAEMLRAIRCSEPRSRRRSGADPLNSLLVDRHEYLRLLRGDQRRARRAALRNRIAAWLRAPFVTAPARRTRDYDAGTDESRAPGS
jgi:hypothetical protein